MIGVAGRTVAHFDRGRGKQLALGEPVGIAPSIRGCLEDSHDDGLLVE
jgi:hypothetical protein